MKNLIIAAVIITNICSGQTFEWATSDNFPSSVQISKDSKGNIYTNGFVGNIFPQTASQLKKFNSSGTLKWTVNLGISDTRLAVTASDIILFSGADSSGYFLKKYDTAGVLLQSTLILQAKNKVHKSSIFAITSDINGNIYLTGSFKDTLNIGNETFIGNKSGYFALFIAKINPSGTCLWIRGASKGNLYTRLTCVTEPNGTSYVGGEFMDTLKIGALILPGNKNNLNGFICKISTSGTEQWLQNVGNNSGQEYISSLATDLNGDLYATGSYNKPMNLGGTALNTGASDNNPNIFLWKLSSAGQSLWCRQIGGSAKQFSEGLATHSTGVYVVGSYTGHTTFDNTVLSSSTGPENYEPFVCKYSSNGNLDWAINIVGKNASTGLGLSICSSFNGVYITGEFRGTMYFGSDSVNSSNFRQFVAKINDGLLSTITNQIPGTTAFRIFPNPTTGIFHVNATVSKFSKFEFVIINSNGQQILNESYSKFIGEYSRDFDLRKFPGGIYIIEISIDGKRTMKRQVLID